MRPDSKTNISQSEMFALRSQLDNARSRLAAVSEAVEPIKGNLMSNHCDEVAATELQRSIADAMTDIAKAAGQLEGLARPAEESWTCPDCGVVLKIGQRSHLCGTKFKLVERLREDRDHLDEQHRGLLAEANRLLAENAKLKVNIQALVAYATTVRRDRPHRTDDSSSEFQLQTTEWCDGLVDKALAAASLLELFK